MSNLKSLPEQIRKAARLEMCRRHLLPFTLHTMPSYQVGWHHEYVANLLTEFAHGKIKKLMLSMPPQHGKSELASRRLVAFLFGINPDLRIAGASYNDTFAAKFNRQVQRIIDSPEYREVFPNTTINSKSSAREDKANYLRNSHEFEIVGHKGSYLSVGVGGGITGNPVDILIWDDLIKGRKDAASSTIRQSTWDWYTDDAGTRMHNASQELGIMTRWHDDDPMGRILQESPEDWVVVNLPAIKVDNEDPNDPREIGAALWEEKHSKERILKIKKLRPKTFNSLYQGKPTPGEGDKIKRAYFEIVNEADLPEDYTNDLYIDGAYTKKTENDPTGVMSCFERNGFIYVTGFTAQYLEMPELLKLVPTYATLNNVTASNSVRVEPKASGKTLKQLLISHTKLNASEIEGSHVAEGKAARVEACLPAMLSGKIKILKGNWNEAFLTELAGFPNAKHDEAVDCLCYAIYDKIIEAFAGIW